MSQDTKKSGKGNSHGVISEVSAYLTVKPGHEEEARAACQEQRRKTRTDRFLKKWLKLVDFLHLVETYKMDGAETSGT